MTSGQSQKCYFQREMATTTFGRGQANVWQNLHTAPQSWSIGVKDLSSNVQAPQVHQVRRPASHERSNQCSDHRSEYKSSSKPASSTKPCHRCGGEGHTAYQCRFKDAEWRYCHKKGHIATVCWRKLRTSKSRPIHTATDTSDLPSGDDNESVFPIDCITNSRSSKPLTVSVIMNSVPV